MLAGSQFPIMASVKAKAKSGQTGPLMTAPLAVMLVARFDR